MVAQHHAEFGLSEMVARRAAEAAFEPCCGPGVEQLAGAADGTHARGRLKWGPRHLPIGGGRTGQVGDAETADNLVRSEEHTSELQSLMRISYAVFCLKKKRVKLKTSIRNK